MLAKTRWSSSQTAVVLLDERFGVPSGQTVATKPRRCSSTTRFMSAVRTFMALGFRCPACRDPVVREQRLPALGTCDEKRQGPLLRVLPDQEAHCVHPGLHESTHPA